MMKQMKMQQRPVAKAGGRYRSSIAHHRIGLNLLKYIEMSLDLGPNK